MISRRHALLSAAAALTGCAARRVSIAPATPHLAPVKVARDRVIREIAGLRPFRPSGFVVRAEKLDSKTVVHNYGHGGAGITLSWGSSQLAVDAAGPIASRDCAVLGCGVMGLSTARLLQQRGAAVTIYTRAMPPETTSNVAGGLWEPVSLFDHDRITPEFRRQYTDASRIAWRRYQSLAGDPYGVRWVALYSLSTTAAHQPPPPDSPNFDVEALYPEGRPLTRAEHPFDVEFAYRRMTMLIEPAIYLNALIRDFLTAGGKLVIRELRTPNEVTSLSQNLVFNCTGLGARDLFGDTELIPIRGQLVFLLPQPEVEYCVLGPGNTYMFPRHDGILLGGSFQRNNSDLAIDPAITTRILNENATLFSAMH